jgi:uncharacterized protein YecA (UPF0149 family)
VRFPESKIKEAILSPELELRVTQGKQKVGRNDPCPCGSGKKFKNCCLRK